ncbi:hypothetical protein F4775DRAFT_606410 [Biscogniauxia sp. FL1348]|nr:hypothetical protein F4775DRAFT_606410 [Biscogniauxia sp. FL1348]
MREGTYEQFEIDALQQISNRLGKEEADERFLYENHISHGAVRPLELQYGFKAPMSQGPEFVARQVQQKTDDMLERQRIRQQDPRYRIRQSWSGDLVSAFTPAEDLPNLPVPGLGKRMYLDPNWTSAPPRTEPWPPGSAPDWSAPDSSFLFQPRPYDFYEARDANNYPDAAAAYAPNLLSPGSTNPSQQSGSSNPPLMGSANRNQDHGARVTSKSKSKTHSAIQHHFSRPASGTPNPARYPPNAFTNAFTSPGNLGRDRSTANPLARTASAAPQVHASAPNLYKSPYNSLGAQSTTRSLSRTASAAPSSRGIGGLSHSVQPAARSLARTYSSAPVRPGSVQIPGNDFGMTPMANAPATAPAFPQVPNVGMGQNTNPWASVAPPPFQAPGPAPATAPPNNNNAQGGNTSGTSGVNITRTTFGGAN